MILFIDDEPAIARLYAAGLQRSGFAVEVCSGGEEALELLAGHDCRLIVSDVEMPGLGGYELARRLTRDGVHPCPILFLTAQDRADALIAGLDSGGDDLLAKGADIDSILQRVRFWLTSGFRGLPAPARRRARRTLSRLAPDSPVLDALTAGEAWLETASATLQAEMAAAPPDFGERLIDRICILGRASHLLLAAAETPAQALRFPDALAAVIARLNRPWCADISVLLAHFDELARDERFHAAGREGLCAPAATA